MDILAGVMIVAGVLILASAPAAARQLKVGYVLTRIALGGVLLAAGWVLLNLHLTSQ